MNEWMIIAATKTTTTNTNENKENWEEATRKSILEGIAFLKDRLEMLS